MKKKVLLLSSSYGNGHLSVANSLKQEFERQDPEIEVIVEDFFDKTHPFFNKLVRSFYLSCTAKAPKIYGFFYYLTKNSELKRNVYINEIVSLIGKKQLKGYLESLKPDVVINTFCVRAMPALYLERKTEIPCFTVITDYGIHSQWIDKGIAKYFVSDEGVKDQLLNIGVPERRIKVTGIPVNMQEVKIKHKKDFIESYGFKSDKMPIVTIIAGAHGIQSYSDDICERLYNLMPQAQFLFICGKNEKLEEKMEEQAMPYDDRIKVQGYANNLQDIMRISDVIVSKPGGITTTEALNIGVPLIIYGIPAGQENENRKFLEKSKCTYTAENSDELVKILDIVISNPEVLNNMRENAQKIARPNGCSDIVLDVIEYMKNQRVKKEQEVVEKV